MNDYKELIAKCDYWINLGDEIDKKLAITKFMEECRDAIERLVKERDEWMECAKQERKRSIERYHELAVELDRVKKERDAAVADLSMHGRYCVTCAHSTIDGTHVWPCNDKRLKCATDDNKNWEWRGVMGDNDEID